MATSRPPLPDVSRFFEDSWWLFRARAVRLLTIAGLGSIGSLVAALIPIGAAVFLVSATSLSATAVWAVAGLLSLSILLWLMGWVQVAMIECALAEEPGASASACFKRGWPKVAAFSWVCVLYLLFVIGGSVEFALPGVFLSIALLFAPFACVAEGVGGVPALTRSLDDTRGYFWTVLLRTGLAGLATSLVSMVPVVGWLLSAVTGPFTLAALAVIYRDLRGARPPTPEPSGRGWLLAAAAAGLVVPAVVGARVIPALAARAPQVVEAVKRMAESPQDPEMPQKILAILQGEASTAESVSAAASLVQQISTSTSTSTAPSPAK